MEMKHAGENVRRFRIKCLPPGVDGKGKNHGALSQSIFEVTGQRIYPRHLRALEDGSGKHYLPESYLGVLREYGDKMGVGC